MKIAVTSTGKTMDSDIDGRFGRCPVYLIIESETMENVAIDNPNQAIGGAGIQSAQLLLNQNIDVVITGNCGPNAFQILDKGDVQVVTGASGKIAEVIEQYKKGQFKAAESNNVQSHHGMA